MTKRLTSLPAVVLCTLGLFCSLSGNARAEEAIRYKPVVVQYGDNNLTPPKVLLVDTKDGHVWLWQERGRKDASDTGFDAQILYQGRLVPARTPGEPVAQVKAHK